MAEPNRSSPLSSKKGIPRMKLAASSRTALASIARGPYRLARRTARSRDLRNAIRFVGLYHGNLPRSEQQFLSAEFLGFTPYPKNSHEIFGDLRGELPFEDDRFLYVQSQDVLEHIPLEFVSRVLTESCRVLKPGGVFRVSLPDYASEFVRASCVFDATGTIVADLRLGGSIGWSERGGLEPTFCHDGNAHLWFPTYEAVDALVRASITDDCLVAWYHYTTRDGAYVVQSFDESHMPVKRVPPKDMRNGGKPVSLVFDIIKRPVSVSPATDEVS